jgi:hypothetical protein
MNQENPHAGFEERAAELGYEIEFKPNLPNTPYFKAKRPGGPTIKHEAPKINARATFEERAAELGIEIQIKNGTPYVVARSESTEPPAPTPAPLSGTERVAQLLTVRRHAAEQPVRDAIAARTAAERALDSAKRALALDPLNVRLADALREARARLDDASTVLEIATSTRDDVTRALDAGKKDLQRLAKLDEQQGEAAFLADVEAVRPKIAAIVAQLAELRGGTRGRATEVDRARSEARAISDQLGLGWHPSSIGWRNHEYALRAEIVAACQRVGVSVYDIRDLFKV